MRSDEYARLLTYRIELLTHHAATTAPDVAHPAIEPPDLIGDEPPPDLDHYPYAFADDESRADDGYDVAVELLRLRMEVKLLEAAGGRSPAAMYATPDEAVAGLDEPNRRMVIAIASSAQAVQILQYATADAGKSPVLQAITSVVRHNCNQVISLNADHIPNAGDPGVGPTGSAKIAQTVVESGSRTLPLGSLVIAEDADQLNHNQLLWLVQRAAHTNTKVLLVMTDSPGDAAAALAGHLPWTQQAGEIREWDRHERDDPLERAEHYVGTRGASASGHLERLELLRRREELVGRYRDLLTDRSRAVKDATRARERDRGLDR